MTPVHYWPYVLRSVRGLNAVAPRTEHPGVLVRIGEGFGCLHPWPELGDAPLEQQLRELAQGPPYSSPLVRGTLECIINDGKARREGRRLIEGPIPESHWLVREGDDPGFARSEGFGHAKIKGSPDLNRVRETASAWAAAGLRVRLDFNESLREGQFLEFWQGLGPVLRGAIDFVEDPERWSEQGWEALRRAGVPVAVDRDHPARLRRGDVLVYKPARHGFACDRETRICITSNMDHALGQAWAAAFAAIAASADSGKQLLPCGLLSHRCFEDDPFFERFRCDGPRLQAPAGTGLGFDDLLERLPWKRLR